MLLQLGLASKKQLCVTQSSSYRGAGGRGCAGGKGGLLDPEGLNKGKKRQEVLLVGKNQRSSPKGTWGSREHIQGQKDRELGLNGDQISPAQSAPKPQSPVGGYIPHSSLHCLAPCLL